MAKGGAGRAGGRARKRSRSRGGGQGAKPSALATAEPPLQEGERQSTPAAAASDKRARQRAAREAREAGRPVAGRDPGAVGERPQSPWHPLPLSELLILVGLVLIVIGVARGSSGLSFTIGGVVAVLAGTVEFTIREHRTGYRSHTSLLAAIPTALFHGAAALGLAAAGASRALVVLAPLALDVPLFALLFKLLRARFDDARRERVFNLRAR